MLRLIVSRLIQLPLILAVIFVVTFSLAWIIPGNPLERPQGERPSPAIQQAMLKKYNLDSPWHFAAGYLDGVFLHADFGPSLRYSDETVSGIIERSLPVSVMLGALALAAALFIGTLAGVVGALFPGSPLDLASLTLALVGISLPNFVTGSIFLVVFVGLLHWFPLGYGFGPQYLVLPALTLSLMPAAYIARLIRLGLADIMSSDYIRTARAKGASRSRALFKHAMKVAYLPVLSYMGPAAAAAMTGSFVVEKVFNIPGIGTHFVNAVLDKDQFLILGVVLLYSTMLVLFNLIVDVLYAFLDPRIEL